MHGLENFKETREVWLSGALKQIWVARPVWFVLLAGIKMVVQIQEMSSVYFRNTSTNPGGTEGLTSFLSKTVLTNSTQQTPSWDLYSPICNRTYSLRHIITRFNPLNPELNPICYLLALLGAHHILHVSRIRVKCLLTFNVLESLQILPPSIYSLAYNLLCLNPEYSHDHMMDGLTQCPPLSCSEHLRVICSNSDLYICGLFGFISACLCPGISMSPCALPYAGTPYHQFYSGKHFVS